MHTDRHESHKYRRRALRWLPGLLGALLLLLTPFLPASFASTYALAGGMAVLVAIGLDYMHNRHAGLARRDIDRQLRVFAEAGDTDSIAPEPVPVADAATVGWNRLAEAAVQLRALEGLERRVCERLESSVAGGDEGILDSLGEGVGVTDLEGRLTVINTALNTLLGTQDETKIQGRSITELLESIARDAEPLADAAHHCRPVTVELKQEKAGVEHYLRCARRPRFDDDAEIVGHVWTVRDVTQQKLAEQSREEFVSTASHELRTPLANIRAYAETLALNDQIDVERQKGFLNTIHTESTRLSRFVDDLLDVTRMQCGNVTLDSHETDLERLVRDVVDKVAPEMERKRQAFQCELPPKLPKLNADKDKLAAALVNLLGNAAKYTPEEGEVQFRVETEGTRVAFTVEDTGIGIAAEELPRVFDRFFRSEDDQVREITGSGLGLAFTREVARLHGGIVEVQSEPGKGSRFTMTIPLG